ncbi:MAG: DUF3352 domain-containing protein [Candidatus Limnocylindria bacterium]
MSESVQTVERAPAWRTPVIAIVAILAIAIGVLAGSVLLSNRAAAVGSGAAYVPANAAMYMELRLQPSEAQDAALRDILGRFPEIEELDLDRTLHDQLTERLDEMLTDEGTDLSWETDIAPWFDGRVAVAVTDIQASAMEAPVDPMAVPEVPPTVMMLGVTDRDAAEAGIARLLAAGGEGLPSFTTVQHRGFTIRVMEGSEYGAYALTDDQLILGSDAEVIQAALDIHSEPAGSLAEMTDMTKLTDTLPDDWLAFMTYDLNGVMAEAMAAGASASPAVAEAFSSLMEHQSLRGAMAFSASEGRLLLDAATDAPTGPLAMENADRGLADEVPGDALYYADAGNLGAAFAAVIEPMKEAMGTTPDGDEQLRAFESALGGDLEELVSWIDDGAVAIGATDGEPWGGMVLVPNDVAAAERRLGQLASFAGLGALDPSSGISVDEQDVDGVTVTTIRWEDPNATPDLGMGMGMGIPTFSGVVVEYALTDDRALIGLGDAFVRRVLGLDVSDSLASQPRYGDALAEFGGSENAGTVWVDLAGVRGVIETALGPMIDSGDPDGVYASEIRPWLLPFDRIIGVIRIDDDVMIQRGALLFE